MRRAAAAALLLIALAAGWFAWQRGALGGGTRPRSVLLISVDTLRADRVGSYGYAAASTPIIDALAARGLRFAQATTVVPLTLPAHTSLLTGTFPTFHGVRDNGGFYVDESMTTLGESLQVSPDDPRLIETDGDHASRRGEAGAAVQAYQRVAALAPRDALIRVKLGELFRDVGRPEDAVRLVREAVSLDPSVASYWNSLGMLLGGEGDFSGAEQAFREAVARDAVNAQYAYNLGLALARQQKGEEAAAQFRRALGIDPKFAPARERLAELR